jgi:hypothetical protein
MVRVRGVRGFSIVAVAVLVVVMITQVRRGPAPRSGTACSSLDGVRVRTTRTAQRGVRTPPRTLPCIRPHPASGPLGPAPPIHALTSGSGLRRCLRAGVLCVPFAVGCRQCSADRMLMGVQVVVKHQHLHDNHGKVHTPQHHRPVHTHPPLRAHHVQHVPRTRRFNTHFDPGDRALQPVSRRRTRPLPPPALHGRASG